MVVFLSLAVSAWRVYQDNVINDDAVVYLEAAEVFASGGWTWHGWPLYALLIAMVHWATGLGLESAAHVVNAGLYALVAVFFVRLVQVLSEDGQVTAVAAIVVLLYPGLNDYRSMIIRDPGYWAFFLLATILFMQFFVEPRWRYAVGWAVSMLVAALFRVEGFILLFFLPFIALARRELSWSRRFVVVGQASVVLVVIMLVQVMVGVLVPGWSLQNTGRLASVVDWLGHIGTVTVDSLSARSSLINETLGLGKYAWAFVVGGLLGFLVLKWVKVLTPVYAVLFAYAVRIRAWSRVPHVHLVWIWLIILNVLILFAFTSKYFVLQGRYLVALCLLLLLPVSFVLVSIYRRWTFAKGRGLRERWVLPVVIVLLLGVAIDGLYSFGPDKNYIKEAGLWVKGKRSGADTVFANDQILLYYAGESGITTNSRDYSWDYARMVMRERSGVDYYAIRVSRREPEREKEVLEVLGKPLKRFENAWGDKVLVFAGRKVG